MGIYSQICNALARSVDLLYPRKCLVCKSRIDSTQNTLCIECWSKLVFITETSCQRCGKLFEYQGILCVCKFELKKMYAAKMVATLHYNEIAMRMISQFKYYNHTEFTKLFGYLLWLKVKDWILEADIITPIPLHPNRLKKRGYNQAALLAVQLATKSKLQLKTNSLTRTVDNKPQMGMNYYQRVKNVHNIFMLEPKHRQEFSGKSVVLVDDVITTGATSNEAARVLIQDGNAAKVIVVSLART